MKNPGIRYGVLGGLAVVLYFFIFYYAQKSLFINPVVQWASMGIYLACMVQAAREDFALHGMEHDFRLLTRTPFLVFILINLAYFFIFYYAQKSLFINPVVQWASMGIYLACMVQAAREDFALHGMERDFRLLTRTPFLVFIVTGKQALLDRKSTRLNSSH